MQHHDNADRYLLQHHDNADRYLLQHHDNADRYLLKHFIFGFIAVYIEDPINVSQLGRYSTNSFL